VRFTISLFGHHVVTVALDLPGWSDDDEDDDDEKAPPFGFRRAEESK
jgi:hypothetical protein